jgi:cell division transport system permease protein
MSIGYMVKEAGVSIKRNLAMTVAAIVVVGMSLFLVGSALLLRQSVNRFSEKWQGTVELSVFMQPTAAQSQIDSVRADIEQLQRAGQQICDYRFVDKNGAYEEFVRYNEGKPEIINAITPDNLPTSFRIQPCEAAQTEALQTRYKEQPGVAAARAPIDAVKRTLEDGQKKQRISLVISLVLLATALVLIFVTVQLAIYARRREVAVMKLVGATNWFIRTPFMLEGVLQAMVGALVAGGFLYVTRDQVVALVGGSVIKDLQLTITGQEAIMTGAVVLVFGLICGVVSSYVSTWRYLRV